MRHLFFACMLCGSIIGSCSKAQPNDAAEVARLLKRRIGVEETLFLEYLNRARLDPREEAKRISEELGESISPEQRKFLEDMRKLPPAPPLVFDPLLNQAATNHAAYLLDKKVTGPLESRRSTWFTGRTPKDRLKKVGFFGFFDAEITAAGLMDTRDAFRRILFAEEDAANVKGAHRRALFDLKNSVMGVGLISERKGDDSRAVVYVGIRDHRRLGGVVFDDRDGDRTYDIGEGIGDVEFQSPIETTNSWDSGAFTLVIPETATKVDFVVDGRSLSAIIPSGDVNERFSIRRQDAMTAGDLGKQILGEIAVARKTEDEQEKFRQFVTLYLKYQFTVLPAAVADTLLSETASARMELEKDQDQFREWFLVRSGSPVALARSIKGFPDPRVTVRKYRNTPAHAWFVDSLSCFKLNGNYSTFVNSYDIAPIRIPEDRIDTIRNDFLEKMDRLKTTYWRSLAISSYEEDFADLKRRYAPRADQGEEKQ